MAVSEREEKRWRAGNAGGGTGECAAVVQGIGSREWGVGSGEEKKRFTRRRRGAESKKIRNEELGIIEN